MIRLSKKLKNTAWFCLAFGGALANGVWFELCDLYGVHNWFALALFILCFVHAVHYANAR